MVDGSRSFVKWIIGGGVIAVAIGAISMLNFGDNIVYFYTPQEAIAKASDLSEKTIKVGALVMPGSVDWQPEEQKLAFKLIDTKGNQISVSHVGVPPDMFKENQGVVVEGRIASNGSSMVSRNLMVKHSEEYKKPEDHSTMNKALLEKSIFKGEEKSR